MTGESVKARGEQEKKHVGENRREKNYSPDKTNEQRIVQRSRTVVDIWAGCGAIFLFSRAAKIISGDFRSFIGTSR